MADEGAGERAVVSGFVRYRLAAGFLRETGIGRKESGDAIGVFLGLVGTCGIYEDAAGRHIPRGCGKDLVLKGDDRLQAIFRPAPARIGAAAQHARVGTGRIDKDPVELPLPEHSSGIIIARAAYIACRLDPVEMKTGKIFAKAPQPGGVHFLRDKYPLPIPRSPFPVPHSPFPILHAICAVLPPGAAQKSSTD